MVEAKTMHRILVVGVGSIGQRHTQCLLETGRAKVGIVELNEETREAASQQYDLVGAYSSIETALEEEWDAALIATPANTHIAIARSIVSRNLSVLIEKPLSTNMEGVRELLADVEDRSLFACVSYNHRAHPALGALKRAVVEGGFGEILQMVFVLGQSFIDYRPAYRDIYFADHKQGGGAIQDSLTHGLNAGEWIAGPIDRILVDAGHQFLPGVEVEDTVHAVARHGKVMASYVMNLYQFPNESTLTVVCEKGTLRYEVHEARWRWMDKFGGSWHEETFEMNDRNTWYIHNANAFLDTLEGKAEPLCSLSEGVQTLRANLAALKSAETQTWQQVSQVDFP